MNVPTRRRYPLLARIGTRTALVAGTVVLVAGLVVAGLVVAGHRHSPSLRSASPTRGTIAASGSTGGNTTAPATGSDPPVPLATQQRQMLGWARANLSPDAVVVADPTTAARLRDAGFTKAVSDDRLDGLDWRTVDYVVSVNKADTESPIRTHLEQTSAPVAVFSSGATPVTVAQVFPQGIATLKAREKADLAARRSSGLQLSQNPNIKALGNTARLLRTGQLDLRASTVLALLAQAAGTSPVMLKSVTVSPADARAGLPAHTMTVAVPNGDEAQTVLGTLTGEYRPRSTTTISQGTMRLDWTPGIAVVLPFQ